MFVTPVHSLEDPLQSRSPKRTSTPVHSNPASRKIPKKCIAFKSRPDSSQARLTGQPRSSIRHADSASSSSSQHAEVFSEEASPERSLASGQEEEAEVHQEEDQASPEKPSSEKRFAMLEKKLGSLEGGLAYLVRKSQAEEKKLAEEREVERIREQERFLLEQERVLQEKLEERARLRKEKEEADRLRKEKEEADRREWEEEQSRMREETDAPRERQQVPQSPSHINPQGGFMGAASTPGMVALSDFNALYERVNRLQAQLDRDNEVDEIPFGDSVRTESRSPQSLLEKVGPCFQGKVKKVVIQSSQKTKFKYFFDFSDNSGWWSKPEALDTYHPMSAVRDTYGYFSVLNAPTIHRNWKFTTLPEESIEQEDENGETQGEEFCTFYGSLAQTPGAY